MTADGWFDHYLRWQETPQAGILFLLDRRISSILARRHMVVTALVERVMAGREADRGDDPTRFTLRYDPDRDVVSVTDERTGVVLGEAMLPVR